MTIARALQIRRQERCERLAKQIRAELGAWCSAAKLAKWLQERAGSISDWIAEGQLDGYRVGKRGIRIPAESIAQFLVNHRMV